MRWNGRRGDEPLERDVLLSPGWKPPPRSERRELFGPDRLAPRLHDRPEWEPARESRGTPRQPGR